LTEVDKTSESSNTLPPGDSNLKPLVVSNVFNNNQISESELTQNQQTISPVEDEDEDLFSPNH